jgi:uncharacterized protein YndB with AHSA1/START domain
VWKEKTRTIGTVDFGINVDIAATPDRVWAVMSDIEKWHEWTPSVKGITRRDQGPLRPGSRAWVRQPKFPPALWTVTEVGERSFTWVSRAPGMVVTARHDVTPIGTGARATLSLNFAGLFGPFFGRLTREINNRYLAMEAAGLKRRSESVS